MVNSYLMGLHSHRPGLKQNSEKDWLSTGSGPLQSPGPPVSVNPVVSTHLHMLSIKVQLNIFSRNSWRKVRVSGIGGRNLIQESFLNTLFAEFMVQYLGTVCTISFLHSRQKYSSLK